MSLIPDARVQRAEDDLTTMEKTMKKLFLSIAIAAAVASHGSASAQYQTQCRRDTEALISRPSLAYALCEDDRGTRSPDDDRISLYTYDFHRTGYPESSLNVYRLRGDIVVSAGERDSDRRLWVIFTDDGPRYQMGDQAFFDEYRDRFDIAIAEFLRMERSRADSAPAR